MKLGLRISIIFSHPYTLLVYVLLVIKHFESCFYIFNDKKSGKCVFQKERALSLLHKPHTNFCFTCLPKPKSFVLGTKRALSTHIPCYKVHPILPKDVILLSFEKFYSAFCALKEDPTKVEK